jgi:aspartyl protease family protein
MLLALLACLPLAAQAVDKVQVLALFPGKAMLVIDGKQRLLQAGQRSPEGVELLSATPREAAVRWDGEQRTLKPGGGISTRYAKPRQREVRIVRDNSGSYTTSGTINGRPVDFLLDTGASGVAMSAAQAKALNIPYLLTGTPVSVGTAGGVSRGYQVVLDRVRIGEVELRRVEGVVIEAQTKHRILLGMSFLRRLEMRQRNNVLLLRQR